MLTHEDFIRRQREHGFKISSIFSIPGLKHLCIKHDWLHAADIGISADFLGGTFQYLIDKYMAGDGKIQKCSNLFAEMRDFYSANNSENRLLRLTPGMLTKDSKKNKSKGWPKLRAKAGECRSLISFTRLVVEKHCDKDTEFEVKLRQASRALEGCYECLSPDAWSLQTMQNRAKKFAQYFLALSEVAGQKYYRAKPKLHAFMEISRSPVCPSKTWSYRDESFGRSMSLFAKRRGGEFTVLAVSKSMLLKFAADHPKPPFLQ